MGKPLETKLKDLFEVRNILTIYAELIEVALQLTREKLRTQTASLFLFSKHGILERVAIQGLDKDGNLILSNWFPEEKFYLSNSFTTSVVSPIGDSPYGEQHWSNNLDNEKIDPATREAYTERLGALVCAITPTACGNKRCSCMWMG